MTDFAAASAVSDILRSFDKGKQLQILRWVSESLDLSLGVSHSGTPSFTPASSAVVQPHSQAVETTDIRSFIASKEPKSDNQFAAAVAYYYRFVAPPHEQKDSIDSEDLQDAARKAGRSRLSRPDKTLANAMSTGYLDRAGKGEFRINTVGENLVAMALTRDGDQSNGRGKRTKKTAKKKAAKKVTKKKK